MSKGRMYLRKRMPDSLSEKSDEAVIIWPSIAMGL